MTNISWNWGLESEISFDPKNDYLNLTAGMGLNNIKIGANKNGDVTLEVPDNHQIIVLKGVGLNQFGAKNILINSQAQNDISQALTAEIIFFRGSAIASVISAEETIMVRGNPVVPSRPRISIFLTSFSPLKIALPIVVLIASDWCSPIIRPNFLRT
jgi:hypothetical protein